MRMYDIIAKKRDGGELTKEEIHFFVSGYTAGEIPDYQVSALLMAIALRGMTPAETAELTLSMASSGETADLSSIPGVKADKHSTGGVGDKTTLIVAPVVASLGVKVAKMSGRGLGHTGGTVDKLRSIPGMRMSIGREEFYRIVRNVGLSLVGQSGNLVPADKKLYALRDVTATVESLPLIASSIMSKKIAAGADCILLDVKAGSGAFMKTPAEAVHLAETMVAIGEHAGRRTAALITDMSRPLGNTVGNSLEVREACDTLRGHGPADLTELSTELAANLLHLAGKGTVEACRRMAANQMKNGEAFDRLEKMVAAQGGDTSVLENGDCFPQAKIRREILSEQDGFLCSMDTEAVGTAAMRLGAGRETKDDEIDSSAGIVLRRKPGDRVRKGEPLAVFHTSDVEKFSEAGKLFRASLTIRPEKPEPVCLVKARVTRDGVERFGA